MTVAVPSPSRASAWTPLRGALFRAIWIATVVSLIGSEAQNAGGPYLMRVLTANKMLVALVTTAGSLAICLLSLGAGVLADQFDRRRLLILTQVWMILASGALGLLYYLDLVSPAVLLALTFLLGVGAALSGPAFQAIVPELVGAAELPQAIGLNSVALNVARAVGPAIGMLAVNLAGPGACFLFNAATFLGVAWVIWRWDRPSQPRRNHPESLLGALSSGFRYTRYSAPLRAVVVRVVTFIFCASALWGLVVVIAVDRLHAAEGGVGLLMAFVGIGAVGGVFLMPWLQHKLSTDGMVNACTALFALGMLGLALGRSLWFDCPLMLFLGANWVIIPTNFNVATQRSVPNWIRARALSVYLTVLWGSMGLGAAFWGFLANRTSLPVALACSSASLAAGLLLVRRFPLTRATGVDFRPAGSHLLRAGAPVEKGSDPFSAPSGPVCVTIEYRIPASAGPEFALLMRQLRTQRMRDGAASWALAAGDAPHTYIESFMLHSWAQRQRLCERMTVSDRQVEDRVVSLHAGAEPPRVRHQVDVHPNWPRLLGRAVDTLVLTIERARR